MSKGQQRARSRAIQQRAEHKARRRRLRKGQVGAAVVTSATLALAGLVPAAHAVEGEPHLVADIKAGAGNGAPPPWVGSPRAVLNGILYFTATDATHGEELWRSDGTPSGTFLVKDIVPGPNESYISGLAVLGNSLFIAAESGLWKSDGSSAATVRVDAPVDYLGEIAAAGGILYFSTYDEHGQELWRSDGTPEGTAFLKDLDPGTYTEDGEVYPNSSRPQDLTAVGDTLYFTAETAESGRELWKSGGTPPTTTRVKDINEGDVSSDPSYLTAVGDTLYFTADDGTTGSELWKSSSAGTSLVKDIRPGTVTSEYGTHPASSYIYAMAAIGDTIYFGATDGSQGSLWRSNGTSATTTAITGTPDAGEIVAAGNTLYFAGYPTDPGAVGIELWRSNGAAAGTSLVKDIYPGTYVEYGETYANDSQPGNFALAGNLLFFDAYDGTHGRELWAMDLAAPGTPPVPLAPVGPSAACVAATQSATSATGALAKAKAALKKAKKAHNATKVKKAKKKVKKAKKKVASTAATKSAACG